MITEDVINDLLYIADSPPKDCEGFNPRTIIVAKYAIAEIQRLRASQFRWIPVGESWPDRLGFGPNGILCMRDDGLVFMDAHYVPPKDVTHWAPIPPLPEKSQEEKDEELWLSFCGDSRQYLALKDFGYAKTAFLAGLKAAREQK